MECNVDGCAYSFVWNSENGVRQQITPPEGFVLPDGCYKITKAKTQGLAPGMKPTRAMNFA